MTIAYLLVAATIVFTVLGQYFQKLAADQLLLTAAPGRASGYLPLLFDPRLLAAASCLGVAMLFWLLALQRLDVSLAYPLLAVNYVAMLLLARWRFHEVIPPLRWLGVLSILAGIAMITGA